MMLSVALPVALQTRLQPQPRAAAGEPPPRLRANAPAAAQAARQQHAAASPHLPARTMPPRRKLTPPLPMPCHPLTPYRRLTPRLLPRLPRRFRLRLQPQRLRR
jgi:hypothetical protein